MPESNTCPMYGCACEKDWASCGARGGDAGQGRPLAPISLAVVLTHLLLTGLSGHAFAQSPSVVEAHPVDSSITIDGQLGEAAWQEAAPATDFLQYEPAEGAAATQPTEVRVLYGASSLYIGAMLYDEQPERIERSLGRRDDFNQADWFVVSLDSHLDRRTAFVFAVNAAGLQYDAIQTGADEGPGGGPGPGDNSWDAVWESGAEVTSEGWTVEMRIPYSMLRFPEAPEQTWGIHFTREIPRLGERVEWPLVARTERSNLVANYGQLQGLRGIEPRRNLQVRPYTVSQLDTGEDPNRPGRAEREGDLDAGADVKLGIGSNLTLDMTLNPDFGQVEADPAELNLTAFETVFDERRPFFLEGLQIYEFGLGQNSDLLYTRRIGAIDPIIAASKLSARTGGGLSFGALAASTGRNLNPRRHYGVARLSQEIGTHSSLGGILTTYDGPGLDARHRSIVGGADWDLRFGDNGYGIEGFATVSHRRLPGEEEPIETGFAGSLELEKRRGIWRYNTGLSVFDNRYNPNDLGLLRRNDYIRLEAGLDHEINGGEAFGPFQRADAEFSLDHEWSYDGLSQGLGFSSFSDWTLRSFQRIEHRASGSRLLGGYDIYETRGLGPWAAPAEVDFNLELGTDSRRRWELETDAGVIFHGDGGRGYELELEADLRAGSHLSLTGSVEAGWERGVTAWSSNETLLRQPGGWHIGSESRGPDELEPEDFVRFDDQGQLDDILAGADPADGSDRYFVPIFGSRDARSLDLTLRSTLSLTPQLSLEVYGQLFLARGQYEDFQVLRDPDTLVPFEAFPKRDAFSLHSFQSNMVLRWEYLPGSNVYLVWAQGRQEDYYVNPLSPTDPSPYHTSVGEQIGDTFRIFPDNQFLIKVDYTFLR